MAILGPPTNPPAEPESDTAFALADQDVHQVVCPNGYSHPQGPDLLDSSILRRQKFCPRCGKLASYSFKWCPGCGARLTQRAPLQANAQAE